MTILIADPRVVAIPVVDAGEPLVDLRHLASGASAAGHLVRRGLATRLRQAAGTLPFGWGFKVVEGYRTAEDQRKIIDAYAAELLAAQPDLDGAELARLTSRHVAPLDVAPHVAGAAVDLTLIDSDGDELWMGSLLDATPEQSDGACYTAAAGLDPEVVERRSVMGRALHGAGLVNYPTEWWHWSFGDRYWALVTGSDRALYGPVTSAVAA